MGHWVIFFIGIRNNAECAVGGRKWSFSLSLDGHNLFLFCYLLRQRAFFKVLIGKHTEYQNDFPIQPIGEMFFSKETEGRRRETGVGSEKRLVARN